MSDGFTTTEGFWLSRPLLLPDVQSFGELFKYIGESDTEQPAPRIIGDAEGNRRRGNAIGPFCTIELGQLGGKAHRGVWVIARDIVIEAVRGRIVTPDDTLSFNIIGHSERNRALVILKHGYIIGDHWLAYIDPLTIPPYPYEKRDKRFDELAEAMRANDKTPFRRELADHALELTTRDDPSIRAVVDVNGDAELTWPDGWVTR